MSVIEAIRRAREASDMSGLLAAVPYAQFLGFEVLSDGEGMLGRMRYQDHLVGNASIPALHGGALGALLELTSVFTLLWEVEVAAVPKIISITVEYLRSGQSIDTLARASFVRQGRRVANVRAVAWQDDPARPIAAANAHFLLAPAEPSAGS